MAEAECGAGLVDVGGVDLLAISMGNTRTRLGTFVGGRLVDCAAFDNQDGRALVQRLAAAHRTLSPGTAMIMASVNPPLAEQLNREVERSIGASLRRIEGEVPVPLRRTLDPGTAVGQDRLVDALAAYALAGACVVVDAGTAITVDLVDGDATFRGGAIAPGARLMLGALHARTAQLPEVAPGRPARAAGRSTAEAMRSGVFHALRGMVSELSGAYAAELGRDLPVIATGGDAEWLFAEAPRVARIVPELPLWGIALSWRAAAGRGAAGRRE